MTASLEASTYASQDPTNVHANGYVISRLSTIPGLTIGTTNTTSLNAQFLSEELNVLRSGYIGPLKLLLNSPIAVTSDVTLYLWQNSLYATSDTSDGFQLDTPNLSYLQCYFATTTQPDVQLGCQITTYQAIGSTYANKRIQVVLTPDAGVTLAANTDYYVYLQTMNKASTPSQYGITYPTGVGTYKIDLTAQGASVLSSLYVDVVSS